MTEDVVPHNSPSHTTFSKEKMLHNNILLVPLYLCVALRCFVLFCIVFSSSSYILKLYIMNTWLNILKYNLKKLWKLEESQLYFKVLFSLMFFAREYFCEIYDDNKFIHLFSLNSNHLFSIK